VEVVAGIIIIFLRFKIQNKIGNGGPTHLFKNKPPIINMPKLFGKGRKNEEDEISKLVSSKQLPPPPARRAKTSQKPFQRTAYEEEVEDFEPELPVPPAPKPAMPKARARPKFPKEEQEEPEFFDSRSPPLFIKIDKYRELVKEIEKLKSYALGLRDAMDALAEVENELKQGLEVAQKALDTFNSIITILDSKLLRIQGIESDNVEIPIEMEDYVKNVHDQLEKIRHEIRTISRT